MALGLEGAIAQDLHDNGFGTYDDTDNDADIRVGEEPPRPDSVITILNVAGGRIPSRMSEEWLISVRVRDESYETANSRLRAIAIHLQEKEQGFFGNINIGRIAPSAPPTPLGRNEQGRHRVEQLFSVLMKRSFTFA